MLIFRNMNGRTVPLDVTHEMHSYRAENTRPFLKKEHLWLGEYYFRSPDVYVKPNAHCPVCGAIVFYYEHPNGAKVYFDELGPPWPKHPCTDNGSLVLSSAPVIINYVHRVRGKYTWETEGWKPVEITAIDISDRIGNLSISAKCGSYLLSFRISSPARKKLMLGVESIKDALVQCLFKEDEVKISIQTGVSDRIIEADLLGLSDEKNSDFKKNILSNLKLQLPNVDGELAFLIGDSDDGKVFFIFDNNKNHKLALDYFLRYQPISIVYKKILKASSKAEGDKISFELSNGENIECECYVISYLKGFLSISQRAESISKGKKVGRGNSKMADAFLQAFIKNK